MDKPEQREVLGTGDSWWVDRGKLKNFPGFNNRYDALTWALEDDQISTCLEQRIRALLSKPWTVEPGDERRQSKLAAKALEQDIKALKWDYICAKMLLAIHYRFAVGEVMWRVDGGRAILDDILVRRQDRFVFQGRELRFLPPMSGSLEGEPIPERKAWLLDIGGRNDDDRPDRVGGTGEIAFWRAWLKKNVEKFWAIYLDKFGSPTAVGKYPSQTATREEKQKLLWTLAQISSDSGIIIPSEMEIELLEAARSGSAGYEIFLGRQDAAIAKLYLGQVMTTDAVGGQYKGEMQYDVRQEIVQADSDLLSGSFNSTVAEWWLYYNQEVFPGAAPPQVWRTLEENEDFAERARRDLDIFGFGYRLTPEAVTRVYGEGYEPVSPDQPSPLAPLPMGEGNQPPTPNPLPSTMGFAEAVLSQPQTPEIFAERLRKEAQPEIATMVARLLAELEATQVGEDFDLLAFQERLERIYPELDGAGLTRVMSAAIEASFLAGMVEAAAEAEE